MNSHGALFRFLSLALLVVPALCPTVAGAYETDQFSYRLVPLQDSTEVLDERVNQSIQQIADSWTGPRNDEKFVNKIYNDIGGRHWVDKIERWAMESDQVDRVRASRYESIYSGHPFWATRVAGWFGVGPTIKVNNIWIGSDKLGHFLSQGRKFWRRYQQMGDEAQAAEHSAYTERAIFGSMTTGVYSNADLVANFEGYLFYRSLFEDDIVPGKPSILVWWNGRWVVQRPFTWADHVNAYWDEALNVNHYDSLLYPHMEERLKDFCPDYFERPDLFTMDTEVDQALQEKYADLQLRRNEALRLQQLCSAESTGTESIQAMAGQADLN